MALGRDAISSAHQTNSEILEQLSEFKKIFDNMYDSCQQSNSFLAFAELTDVGSRLKKELETLASAVNSTAEMMTNCSAVTTEFLNKQTRINAGSR